MGDCSHDGFFLGDTVSHDDNVVKIVGVLVEHTVNNELAVDVDFIGLVTDGTEDQCSVFRGRESVITVLVR